MFYCETCRISNAYPESIRKSMGKCELCGAVKDCNDVPSSQMIKAKVMEEKNKEERPTRIVKVKIVGHEDGISPMWYKDKVGQEFKCFETLKGSMMGNTYVTCGQDAKIFCLDCRVIHVYDDNEVVELNASESGSVSEAIEVLEEKIEKLRNFIFVRILKFSGKNFWYSNRVGEIFAVEKTYSKLSYKYKDNQLINMDDCEICTSWELINSSSKINHGNHIAPVIDSSGKKVEEDCPLKNHGALSGKMQMSHDLPLPEKETLIEQLRSKEESAYISEYGEETCFPKNLAQTVLTQELKDVFKQKIYIAGKIGNLPEDIYKPRFEKGKEEVEAMGFIPVSPLDFPHEHKRDWASYMKEDLTEMFKCDAVYALREWRDSPGATMEIEVATKLGINIIFQR